MKFKFEPTLPFAFEMKVAPNGFTSIDIEDSSARAGELPDADTPAYKSALAIISKLPKDDVLRRQGSVFWDLLTLKKFDTESFNESARLRGATFNGELQALWNSAPNAETALGIFNAIHDALVTAGLPGVV